LNKKHAREAYHFANENQHNKNAFWPEIILNIRNRDVVKIVPRGKGKGPKEKSLDFVKIQLFWDKIIKAAEDGEVVISRVDGNHRLCYAGGDKRKGFSPLESVYSPFCIIDGIDVEGEKLIFKTINAEQKKLNVSHLLRIKQDLSTDADLWKSDKELWIAGKLHDDTSSPFYGAVHKGGKKERGETYLIKQKSLRDGIFQLLKNCPNYGELDKDRILKIVMNYFSAVQEVWLDEWKDSKKYKLMTNTGLQALGIIGGKLINTFLLAPAKSLKKEDFEVKLTQLKKQIPADGWSVKGDFMAGKSGRPGAQKIADDFWEQMHIIDNSGIKV
jgi:DGQHR domain-containing protein